MSRENGSVIGVDNTPTTSAASGVWSMNAVARAVKAAIWPNNEPTLKLDFNETTTLDSRITFTRATSATYFDSSGVLQTASSGVARFDHRLEGGVWVNKGLLIEEQRTNVCLRSEDLSTTWTLAEATVTADATTAPDGTTTADQLTDNANNAGHIARQTITGTAPTQNLTWSVFLKNNDCNFARLIISEDGASNQVRAWFDLANGIVGTVANLGTGTGATAFMEDVGNGWYRCILSGKPSTTGSNTQFLILTQTADNQGAYVGTGQSLYAWGAQAEVGAFPTSYIATTTASVTRNADLAVMTGTDFSDWFNATEGTVFTQFSVPVINNVVTAYFPIASCIDDNSDNEAMRVSLNSKNSAASDEETFTAVIIDGGSTLALGDAALINLNGQTNKAAYVYKVNDFAFSGNGGTVSTDTSLTLPTVDRLNIGSQPALSTRYLGGHVAKFYYWNTRKSNTFLQSITG